MMIDITNVRLDEVSSIMEKMDRIGLTSRIERKDDKFFLVLSEKKKEKKREPTLLDW